MVVAVAVLAAVSQRPALAGGVVGTGTPGSCTEAALNAALVGGGSVTFKCGGAATITVASTKTISADTTIDGGSLITISGGHSVGVFSVANTGVKFTVQNLTIANGNNSAGLGGGGIANGGINNAGGTLTVTNSTFSGNAAGNGGGAVFNNGGTLEVTNSTFSGNTAGGGGGAVFNNDGTLTVTNSTFSGNTAGAEGGAVFNNGGTLEVANSTFSGNTADVQGGAIANWSISTVTVTNSTFSGNRGGTGPPTSTGYGGGAIYNDNYGTTLLGKTLLVVNSTFSGNSAGEGGAVYNYVYAALTVVNSTFSGNGGEYGGGIYNLSAVTVTNTIIANSTSGGNCVNDTLLGNTGIITDGGHNIDDGTSCGFSTAKRSLNNTDPKLDLAGLANNGGPTQTIALRAGSLAINAGDEAICSAPPVNSVDQRDFVRPGTGTANCSIGAYEYNSHASSDCCQCPTSCAAPSNFICGGCALVHGATCESGEICVVHTPTPITPGPTPTATKPRPTPSRTPTKTPGANDCCQCSAFCAAPIAGTCGGCAVVFGASCTGGAQCVSRTPTTAPCVGDCNDDGTVTVDEILTMVNIALGSADLATCRAGDANHDGQITIDEILTAVNNALDSCPK